MSEAENNSNQLSTFRRFFRSEVAGSVVLLACAIIALAWANSPWAESYFALDHTHIAISWDGKPIIDLALGHWIGDGLMVIFFFVVGLEIKREVVVGRLSSMDRAILPVSAALGGMIVPALLYILLNYGGEGERGWGVPMATDIAFALGVLALFGKRVPIGLMVFLAALAIADDLGAVLVIAIFYTEQIRVFGLIVAAGFLFLMLLASRAGARQSWIYMLLAVGVWTGVHASGIHATVAGVLMALVVPVRAVIDPEKFLETGKRRIAELEQSRLTKESMLDDSAQFQALDDLYLTAEDMRPPGLALEHQLEPVQAFLILPLFALFKAGVPLSGETAGALSSPVSLGVILGLVLGKPVGVMLFSWLAVSSGKARLPDGVTWGQLLGVSCLAGIGFTMSIFVSELAFENEAVVGQAKIGVLAASVLSGVLGLVVLSIALRKKAN